MKISHIQIDNFRAISHLDEKIGPYTTFIGYNGGGKSSILHALRWFFEGFPLGRNDVFSENPGADALEDLPTVKVSVTFNDITEHDRSNFGIYALGEEMTLSREGRVDGESKLYGSPMRCADFDNIRKASSISTKRKAAADLVAENPLFADLGIHKDDKPNAQELNALLDKWERDPQHLEHLRHTPREEATHFYGAVGTNKLKIYAGFVFIPAAPNLTGEFDSTGKDSALQLLLGDILKGVVGKSVEKWTEKHQTVLDQLEHDVRESAASSLTHRAEQVNHHLKNYLPGTQIAFEAELQDWTPKASPIAKSVLRRGNRELSIESEGHGVQRATLLALLQATADARIESSLPSEINQGESNISSGSLIVCVEEPEVYQHPVQARMMARSFAQAAQVGSVQFILATHSPYFLDPTELQNTLRVSSAPSGSIIQRADVQALPEAKYQNGELDKFFLETIVESLFSKAALVVEGDTDRAVLDVLPCHEDGRTLKQVGISIAVAGGANTLVQMAKLIRSFGVPTYIVRDGDSDGGIAFGKAIEKSRDVIQKNFDCEPDPDNDAHKSIIEEKRASILASWENAVNNFVDDLRKSGLGDGLEDFHWGQGEAIGKYAAILENDLETELHRWPSFMEGAGGLNLSGDLRNSKKAGVLSRAAALASPADAPADLKRILQAVRELSEND